MYFFFPHVANYRPADLVRKPKRLLSPVARLAVFALFLQGLAGSSPAAERAAQGAPALAGTAVAPKTPSAAKKNAYQDKLLGDPWGGRSFLSRHGVDLTLTYLAEPLANIAGGKKRGMTYVHQVTMGMDLDFEKLLGLRGLSFRMLGVQRAGRDVGKDYVSDITLMEPQQSYGVGGNVLYHLVALYLRQSFFNKRLTITAGNYPPNMDFGTFPLGCYTVNNVICSHPIGVSVSSHWRSWPFSDLGAEVEFKPTKTTAVRVGLFQATKHDGGRAGFSITTDSEGIVIPMELDWNPHWGASRLPGHYRLGGYADSSDNPDLYRSRTGAPIILSNAPARTERQRGAWYVGGDQMLYRLGPGERDGIMMLAVATFANGASLPYRHQYTLGLVAQHMFRSRPLDHISLFWSSLQVNPKLTRTQELQERLGLPLAKGVKSVESNIQVIEASYSAHLFAGVSIAPDFQLIIRPDGGSYYKNAYVTGFRLIADL